MEMPTKRAGKISFINKQQQQAQMVRRLEEQLMKAKHKMAEEESKEKKSSSVRVTAFNNPMQSVHSHSNHTVIEQIVPV